MKFLNCKTMGLCEPYFTKTEEFVLNDDNNGGYDHENNNNNNC